MTQRHDITPRVFTANGQLADELAQFAETAQEALDLVPLVSFRWVRGYVATGTEGTAMPPILWPGKSVSGATAGGPMIAHVVRVHESSSPTEDAGNVRVRSNFRFETVGGQGQVVLFEPKNLTANTAYDLVVMLVGGA